ncbi:hypothetical protein M432DRAFT_645352 [Thermoascus aurantiacus ATCC 26904]
MPAIILRLLPELSYPDLAGLQAGKSQVTKLSQDTSGGIWLPAGLALLGQGRAAGEGGGEGASIIIVHVIIIIIVHNLCAALHAYCRCRQHRFCLFQGCELLAYCSLQVNRVPLYSIDSCRNVEWTIMGVEEALKLEPELKPKPKHIGFTCLLIDKSSLTSEDACEPG